MSHSEFPNSAADHIVDLHRHRAELAVSYITDIYHSDRIRSLAILLALYRGGKDKRNIGAYIMARLPTRVRNDLQLNLTFISRTAPTFYEIIAFGKPAVWVMIRGSFGLLTVMLGFRCVVGILPRWVTRS